MSNFLLQPARKGFSSGQLVQNAAFIPLHVTRRADLFPNPFFRPTKKELPCTNPKTSSIYNLCHLLFCHTARPYVQAITFDGLRVKGSKSNHPPAAC